jgi:hypothetical protein
MFFFPNPPKINVRELDEDLDQFAQRLRIKNMFIQRKKPVKTYQQMNRT